MKWLKNIPCNKKRALKERKKPHVEQGQRVVTLKINAQVKDKSC